MKRYAVLCAVAVGVLAGCGNDTASQRDPAADAESIEGALRAWSYDVNERELDAVCGLFADDVIVIYPQSADRDDDTMTFHYAEPDIHEVLVDGDLATARLTWTLTVADSDGQVVETVVEDGVDVFRRQADGSWEIHISHAFGV